MALTIKKNKKCEKRDLDFPEVRQLKLHLFVQTAKSVIVRGYKKKERKKNQPFIACCYILSISGLGEMHVTLPWIRRFNLFHFNGFSAFSYPLFSLSRSFLIVNFFFGPNFFILCFLKRKTMAFLGHVNKPQFDVTWC